MGDVDDLVFVSELIREGWKSYKLDETIADISKSVITDRKSWDIIVKTRMRIHIYNISTSSISIRIDAYDPNLKNELIAGVLWVLDHNTKLGENKLGYKSLSWRRDQYETIDVDLKPRRVDKKPKKVIDDDIITNKDHKGDEGYFCLFCHTLKPSDTPDRECPNCKHTMAVVNYNLYFDCEDCKNGFYVIDCRSFPIPCVFRCNRCGCLNSKSDSTRVIPDSVMTMDTIYELKTCFHHELIGDMIATISAIENIDSLDKGQLKRIYSESLVYEFDSKIPEDENYELYSYYKELVRELVRSHASTNYLRRNDNRTVMPKGHPLTREEFRIKLDR